MIVGIADERRGEVEYGRLQWFEPESLDDDQRHLYDEIVGGPRARDAKTSALVDDQGRLYGPFNAMLLSPDFGEAVQRLGMTVRFRSTLSPRAREMATLVVARASKSDFEWHAHARLGRAAGLTDEEIQAVAGDYDSTSMNDDERLVLRVTKSLIEERDLSDQLFSEVHARLGDVILLELIVLVGLYELLARSMRVWRTPLLDGEDVVFPD
jgi:4-carboxymuconolactone decarboxylase